MYQQTAGAARAKLIAAKIASSQPVKTTSKWVLIAIALVAAYQAGSMSSNVVLTHLSKEVALSGDDLFIRRQRADLNRELARQSLRRALLEAQFAEIMSGASHNDDLPRDRVRVMRARLQDSFHRKSARSSP